MEPASSDDARTVIDYLLATDPDRTLVAVIAWTACRGGRLLDFAGEMSTSRRAT